MTKQVDLLLRDPENGIVTLEVAGLSGGHEVHNALHCLGAGNALGGEVRKHVVVCVSKKVLDEVRAKFAEVPELAGNPRIELVLLSMALKDDWVP